MKHLLLDTHVVLWWLDGATRLGADTRTAIEKPDNYVAVSSITAFEIATKKKLGKLRVPDDLATQLEANAFDELPVTVGHGLAAGDLPPHHRDPFDRLLIAQARLENLTLVTADRSLADYDVPILDAEA